MSDTPTIPSDQAAMPASAVRSNVQKRRMPKATAKLGSASGSTKPTAAGRPRATAIAAVLKANHRPHIAACSRVAKMQRRQRHKHHQWRRHRSKPQGQPRTARC